MSMDNRMIVVYAASRNLYLWLPMAYMSLLKHNPEAAVVCLIEDDELPYEVPGNVGTVNVSGQEWFGEDCPNIRTSFTYLSLMRVCYTKLFPGYDKVIQLDVDTIVTDSLMPIWKIDMDGKYFAAVPEHLSHWKPYGKDYRNVGVCVFNLKQMREDGVDDELIHFLNTNKVPYIDQDALNWLNAKKGGDKALTLGVRYNECFVTGETLRPAVVHAAGTRNWFSNLDEQYRGSYWKPYEQYCQVEACRAAGIYC
jgi:lipopolysaccharide biosynthesis glycosyltransferase